MQEYLQEPEEQIKENLIPSLTGKNTVTTTDRILFSLPVRNGGLNITLPEGSINNVRWSKSLGDCLSNPDPMTAQNSQHRIRRVIREEKKDVDGKNRQSQTGCHGRSALRPATGVGERGIQLAQHLTSQKIRLLINENGVPRWSCNSLWMGTEEHPSIMSM